MVVHSTTYTNSRSAVPLLVVISGTPIQPKRHSYSDQCVTVFSIQNIHSLQSAMIYVYLLHSCYTITTVFLVYWLLSTLHYTKWSADISGTSLVSWICWPDRKLLIIPLHCHIWSYVCSCLHCCLHCSFRPVVTSLASQTLSVPQCRSPSEWLLLM